MKTAVAYARFSTDMQREESIDAQFRAIEEFCKRNEIIILSKFHDKGISGTTDERPQFQQMISFVENNKVDYVIVHKLDRFSRSKYDSAVYKQKIKQRGTRVLSVLENLDDSPESVILESVLEGMSEYYSKNLSREVKKGMKENALKAQFNGGTPPLGFNIDENKKYIINEYEAEAVRIIFDMYIKGFSYNDIINTLNEKGYKTKRGKDFGKNSLYEILGNEKYIGNYLFGGENYDRFNKAKRNWHNKKLREDMIIIEDAIPAIIDKLTWSKAMQRREENKKKSGSYKAKKIYLLSGLVFCEKCGGSMTGSCRTNASGTEYLYYKCNNKNCKSKSIRADKLEMEIIHVVNNVLFHTDNINVIVNSVEKYLQSCNSNIDVENIKKEIIETEKKLEKLVEAIMHGIDSFTISKKIEELENKKHTLINLLQVETNKNIGFDKKDILNFFTKHNKISQFKKEEQKIILKTLIDKITIAPPKVRLYLKMFKNVDLSGAGRGT